MKVTISRKAHFNAAHRLYRKDWTLNKTMRFLVSVIIPIFMVITMKLLVLRAIDPETGYVMDVNF
jgi:6-pyruvoyltetrahydropterin/6-carboxytetrahydropterin synthase